MLGMLYFGVLFGVAVFVWTRGGRDERVAIAALTFGSVATALIYKLVRTSFVDPNPLLFVSDALVLLVLVALAYWSTRFWPMIVAALQIASFLALLTPFVTENLVSYGLGLAQGSWAYLQMVILIVATIRGANRTTRTMQKSSLR